jgi:2-hydroxychromene-2-carboxylate isomerase
MAGSSTAETPAFYFDLASPEAYLSAERVLTVVPGPCEWMPVLARELPGPTHAMGHGEVERLAAAHGLQRVRWPEPFPFDSLFAMRVATYARGIGKAVAFSLAAFRQAYAGGRSLAARDNVVIAAAACEMHPAAVLKAGELRSVRDALQRATAEAIERGVRDVPAVWTPGGVFHGDAQLERAAQTLATV